MERREAMNKQRNPAFIEENGAEAERKAKSKGHTAQEMGGWRQRHREVALLSGGLPDPVPMRWLASLSISRTLY